MGRRLINLLFFCMAVVITVAFSSCSSPSKKTLSDESLKSTIQERLNNITNPKDAKVLMSSNPYDYIKGAESSADYKYIVSQGEKSLNFMLDKFAGSNRNGLEEYIMAIACSEILKEDAASKNWSTGREWYNNYLKKKIKI